MNRTLPFFVLNVPRFVLDACSIIALLKKEDGSEAVADLLEQARRAEIRIFVHKVTLAEVYYDVLRTSGLENADLMLSSFKDASVNVIDDLSNAFIQKVGGYKAHHKISFADAFVLALAQTQNATVVSSDHHEFDLVAQSGILSFFWIR